MEYNENFVRLQTYTNSSLNTFGQEWYDIMQKDGQRMYDEPLKPWTKQNTEALLMAIIDEKYGPEWCILIS